jgi:hypothetical protein
MKRILAQKSHPNVKLVYSETLEPLAVETRDPKAHDYRNPTSTWGAYTCVPPQKNPTGLGHAAVLRCSNCPTSTTAWFKRVPHASADAVKAPTCAQRRKFKEGTNRGNVSSCA